MKIVIKGGSSLSRKELSKDLQKLFKGYGFGKVIVTGDVEQPFWDGLLEDESVEIKIEA